MESNPDNENLPHTFRYKPRKNTKLYEQEFYYDEEQISETNRHENHNIVIDFRSLLCRYQQGLFVRFIGSLPIGHWTHSPALLFTKWQSSKGY